MELLPLWIALGILGALLLFFVVPTFAIAYAQFKKQLVRKDKNHWTRNCGWVNDAEQVEMFNRGEKWADGVQEHKQDVDIVNEGFHLYGEYFDFGFKKAVIIIPGRTEGCHYSHYFAKPYPESGYNVLVIDNRSHGLSDGKYNSLGLKEYKDVIAWGKMLHEKFDVEQVVLHGICIGSATALYALTSPDCPDYFCGIIADGMYTTFRDSFKNHIVALHHPSFPVLQEVMLLIKIFCGVNASKNGPVYSIEKLKKPILFLQSKEDLFSLPADTEKMYEKCAAPKKLVMFDHGRHSHIRINYEEEYDNAIKDFLAENIDEKHA